MRSTNRVLVAILVIAATIASIGAFSVFSKEIQHGPYLTEMTANSVRITWFTDTISTGTVEYGLSSDSLEHSVTETNKGIVSMGYRHTITLDNLKPREKYYYRVVGREVKNNTTWSPIIGAKDSGEIYNFTTFDTEKNGVKFYFLTDVKGDTDRLDNLLGIINTSDCDFVVFGGDQFSTLETESDVWDCLIGPSTLHFAKNIPFFYCRGDDDYKGSFARSFKYYIPTNNKTIRPGDNGKYYYGFNHGRAAFAVLDTGSKEPDSLDSFKGTMLCQPYMKEEYTWLTEYMASSDWTDSSFKIVFAHNPDFGYSSEDYKSLLTDSGTDLVFTGDQQEYVHHTPNSSEDYHKVILDSDKIAEVYIVDNEITVTVLNSEGVEVDTFSIEKREGIQ